MTAPAIVIHRDQTILAEATAARLMTRIVDVQAVRGTASVVLTGGRVGTAVLAAVAASPALAAIDWSHLDIWWGDERFLPAGDAERNETQARAALLDHVPVDPARVHPMAASDGDLGGDVEAAAARYADELAAAARPEDHGPVPTFDVLLLGVGPDAHVASLFPNHPTLHDDRPVVSVKSAPKPPPTRISLTLPTIRRAAQVWLVVAGDDKAQAVHLALSGADESQVPAAGAKGQHRTLWLLDRDAAGQLPPDLSSASP